MRANRFRKDLFYRLNTFVIQVPPLRDRRDDIPALTEYFLDKHARKGNRKVVSKQTMNLLLDYHWPGNVRELANVIERAVLISADREEIVHDDLPQTVFTPSFGEAKGKYLMTSDTLRLDSMEKEHIEKVLEIAGGNKSKAARLLGISRKKLYQKIESN